MNNDLRSKLFARSMLIGGGEPDEAIADATHFTWTLEPAPK